MSLAPHYVTKLVEFHEWYITSPMVSVVTCEILHILWEQDNKVWILSNCMPQIVLCNVYRIAIIVSTSSVVRFSYVLLAEEATVQQQQILLCGVQCWWIWNILTIIARVSSYVSITFTANFFNGGERWCIPQRFLTIEQVGNLLLTQSSIETFSKNLVLLLMKTLSKHIQVIVVSPTVVFPQFFQ